MSAIFKNRPKFISAWYRERAQLMTQLKDEGWRSWQLADRFRLSRERVRIIIHEWRKREAQP